MPQDRVKKEIIQENIERYSVNSILKLHSCISHFLHLSNVSKSNIKHSAKHFICISLLNPYNWVRYCNSHIIYVITNVYRDYVSCQKLQRM